MRKTNKITKNIDLKITTEQTFIANSKPQTIELQTEGVLVIIEDTFRIEYEEILVEASNVFTNTNIYFKKENPDIVYLDRDSDITTTGVFEKDKRYMLTYAMPFGSLELGIYTKILENNITEDGGKLKIVYDVEHLGSIIFSNVFILECTISQQK